MAVSGAGCETLMGRGFLKFRRPDGIRGGAHIGNARQACLHLADVFLQQFLRNGGAHAEDQFLAFFLCLNRFRRELGDIGNEGDFGGNGVLRRGIQHEADIRADLQASGFGCRQEEGHVNVFQIDKADDAATGSQHFAGFGHAILDPPVAWRFQRAIGNLCLYEFNGSLRRVDGSFRIHHLRAGGIDAGFRCGKACPGDG